MTKNFYDIAIIGAGLAGLSIAYRLAKLPLKILLVDQRKNYIRDKTWCYWNVYQHPFQHLVKYRWNNWQVHYKDKTTSQNNPKNPYELINSEDFYRYTLDYLNLQSNVTCYFNTNIENLITNKKYPTLSINNTTYQVHWLLDSRTHLKNIFFWQSFIGWEIEMEQAVFDEKSIKIMDFQCAPSHQIAFIYLLPFSSQKALIEATWFHPDKNQAKNHAKDYIIQYLEKNYPNIKYKITYQEQAHLPMDWRIQAEQSHTNIISIGTASGALKSSTGYGFLAIQKQADNIYQELTTTGKISHQPLRSLLINYLDKLFLHYLKYYPELAKQSFYQLFNNVPSHSLLYFLNDKAKPIDYFHVINTLPKIPLIKTAIKHTWS